MPSKELLIVKQSDLVDYHVLHQYEINYQTVFVPVKYHILEVL